MSLITSGSQLSTIKEVEELRVELFRLLQASKTFNRMRKFKPKTITLAKRFLPWNMVSLLPSANSIATRERSPQVFLIWTAKSEISCASRLHKKVKQTKTKTPMQNKKTKKHGLLR